MKNLKFRDLVLGCDPEFFFKTGRTIIGADKVLPLSGLECDGAPGLVSKVIIDGVQAELNPAADKDIREVGMNIAKLFNVLDSHMKNFERLQCDFSRTVRLSDKEFQELSPDSKKFGCSPSKSLSCGGDNGSISVDPMEYRYRSAGGHIHIGHTDDSDVKRVLLDPEHQVRLVAMLDLLVGNTCVLIDRDRGNVERRKVYGKAGEFRTPKHGVEYRTPSNFWLANYTLMDMVMNLCRLAVLVVVEDRDMEFKKLVSQEAVNEAINTNSFPLALQNFKAIEKYLLSITPIDSQFPINGDTIEDFYHFARMGVRHWYKDDPVKHWCGVWKGDARFSLHDMLTMTVRKDRTNK